MEVVRDAYMQVAEMSPKAGKWPQSAQYYVYGSPVESWLFDTVEEFLAEYSKDIFRASLNAFGDNYEINLVVHQGDTDVQVTAPTRAEIEAVFVQIEAAADRVRKPKPEPKPLPPPPPPVVFIGHGRDPQWRDLKDHLHEKQGYDVEAYEIGARAGHAIRDILQSMLGSSSFALLVMTGEDEAADGTLHARDNVIHEVGLFQGHLGWDRAIVLLEEGTKEFSNIAGIQQIRFAKGSIASTYGDVLATLRREFGAR
jgi:predicted nucleotide-binding protein